MKKQESIHPKTMARQKAVILAVAMFVIGFFTGTGVAVYKTSALSNVPQKTNQSAGLSERAESLENAVAMNPENTSAWIQLGHIYFDTNKYKQAIAAYEKALELNPGNADVLTDLGIMYRRSGKPREAVNRFEMAIAVDPKHETARFNKGIVLMHDLGDRERAIQAWEDLLEINPVAMAGNNQSVDQMIKHYKEGHDR
jgi:cytochrome c-type biogenesis protein CcmH/NrfG